MEFNLETISSFVSLFGTVVVWYQESLKFIKFIKVSQQMIYHQIL